METRMGIEDSLKHSLGPCVSASNSLAVSMYPAGEKGVTFMPSVSEEGIISWENDGGMINPEPVDIHGMNISNIEQTVISSENDGVNIVTIELKDGSKSEIQIKNGSQGDPATIKVGETITGGEEIKVVNSGTEKDVVLDFSFPPVATTVKLNGFVNPAPDFYASISSGEDGQILSSKGENKAPEWINLNNTIQCDLVRYASVGTLEQLVLRPDFRAMLASFKNKFSNNINNKPIFELGCLSQEQIPGATTFVEYNKYENKEDILDPIDIDIRKYYSSAIFTSATQDDELGLGLVMESTLKNAFFFGYYYSDAKITISFSADENNNVDWILINILDTNYSLLQAERAVVSQELYTPYISLNNDPNEIGSNIGYISTDRIKINTVVANEILLEGISLRKTILFEGGELEDIILEDDISNYEFLEIYFSSTDGEDDMLKMRIWEGENKASLSIIHSYGNYCYFKTKKIILNGNEIKNEKNYYSEVTFDENGVTVENINTIAITKVIGYKG